MVVYTQWHIVSDFSGLFLREAVKINGDGSWCKTSAAMYGLSPICRLVADSGVGMPSRISLAAKVCEVGQVREGTIGTCLTGGAM